MFKVLCSDIRTSPVPPTVHLWQWRELCWMQDCLWRWAMCVVHRCQMSWLHMCLYSGQVAHLQRESGVRKLSAFLLGCFLLNFAPQVGGQDPVLLTRPLESGWPGCSLEPRRLQNKELTASCSHRGRSKSQCEGAAVGRKLEISSLWSFTLRFAKENEMSPHWKVRV